MDPLTNYTKYELTDICILYTDPQLITVVITLLWTTTAQKKFLYYLPMGLSFDLGTSTNKGRVSTRLEKSGNFLEDQEKSGKFDIFWKKSGKVREENFYPCKFLTFKKIICMHLCSWIINDNQLYIWCYNSYLVLRWFNIANPFYFNLSEVVFNLDQERKLHAINCVVFFAKAFISSLNSE